jgi:hypothetical protein
MTRWFHRCGKFLQPSDEAAEKALARMEQGESVQLEMLRARSPKFNRMYWGCCREIGLLQEPPRSEVSISDEIKVLAGHYTSLKIAGTDYEIRSPNHINFRAMNAEQWGEYFKKADQVMLNHFHFDSAAWERYESA